MNWVLFALVTWVALGLETGLKPALQLGPTPIAPSFLVPVAVIVTLFAPSAIALWACLIIGVLADLTWSIPRTDGGIATLVGPYALGYFLAGQLILAMRGVMARRNPFTVAFLSGIGALVINVVVVALITLHSFYDDPIDWRPTQQLFSRVLAAGYTAILGFFLAFALLPIAPWLGLAAPGSRRFVRRG